MACAPSEDSDHPGHLPRLIRVFAVCMKKAWVLSYSLSAQRSFWCPVWSESSLGAQSFCWFCHEAAHLTIFFSIIGCGLTQVQYAFANITSKSRLAVKFFAKVIRWVKHITQSRLCLKFFVKCAFRLVLSVTNIGGYWYRLVPMVTNSHRAIHLYRFIPMVANGYQWPQLVINGCLGSRRKISECMQCYQVG